MNKPYLLFRNHNSPYWYAQIRLADGSLSNNKSTGKESRKEAEKVVMEWVVKGECPKRVSKKGNSKNSNSLDTLAILNQLKTKPFSDSEITQILDILKERNFIKTAVRTKSKAAKDAMEFLIEFWDYEKSPYIRELHLRGKSFHKKHSNRMTRIIFNYWEPIINGKLVGEITRDVINKIFDVESTQKLAPKTVKSIINAITVALKWAYLHGLTEINCYDGIIKPTDNPQKRAILTMEEIKLLFSTKSKKNFNFHFIQKTLSLLRQPLSTGLGVFGVFGMFRCEFWPRRTGARRTAHRKRRQGQAPSWQQARH